MFTFTQGGLRIHYNSDFSGDAHIRDEVAAEGMNVPCAVLLAFAAEFVRTKKIAAIEQATSEELLGVVKIPD